MKANLSTLVSYLFKSIMLFCVLSFALGFGRAANKTIKGHISAANNNLSFAVIKLKRDTSVLAQTIVDTNGQYILQADFNQDVDLILSSVGAGDIYLGHINPTVEDTINLSFTLPVKRFEFVRKMVCPKCYKSDAVMIIKYGLGGCGNNTRCFDGGCIVTEISPNWYCSRDKIRF